MRKTKKGNTSSIVITRRATNRVWGLKSPIVEKFRKFSKNLSKSQIILEKHKEKKFERGLNEIRNFSTIGHF